MPSNARPAAGANLSTATKAFRKYVRSTDWEELNTLLDGYLEQVVPLLEQGLSNEQAWRVLAQLFLAFPMHLSRKNVDLREGNIGAIAAALRDRGTTKVKCEELSKRATHEFGTARGKRKTPIMWRVHEQLEIAGYDPRKEVKGLDDLYLPHMDRVPRELGLKSRIHFFDDYNSAKAGIYLDFHQRRDRFDILIVDFSWLPELAYQGLVYPLQEIEPDVNNQVRNLLREQTPDGRKGKPTDDQFKLWSRVLQHLCCAGNDRYYVLPLFINMPGVLVNDVKELGESDYRKMKTERFTRCSVQSSHSACCVYELFKHLAYHGAVPIQVKDGLADSDQVYELVEVSFHSDEFYHALSDYLTRLFLLPVGKQDIIQDPRRRFSVNHGRELKLIADQRFHWAVAFSSELLERKHLQKRELQLHMPCKAPLPTRECPTYLTSLGGYGLAVSRATSEPERAFRASQALFQSMWSGGRVLPSYVEKSLGFIEYLDDDQLDTFLRIHCRPRVPFWTHIEELISLSLENIASLVVRSEELNEDHGLLKENDRFEQASKMVEDAVRTDAVKQLLRRLEQRVSLAFLNNGWKIPLEMKTRLGVG